MSFLNPRYEINTKLYIPSTINTGRKLHSTAILADKKMAGVWQIRLDQVNLKQYSKLDFNT